MEIINQAEMSMKDDEEQPHTGKHTSSKIINDDQDAFNVLLNSSPKKPPNKNSHAKDR